MKRVWCLLVFCGTLVGCASAQAHKLAEGGCAAVDGTFGPLRCPNGSSCGTYSTLTTELCATDNEDYCDMLIAFPVCCGKYNALVDTGDPCLITELRDRRNRSRILELAIDDEILVPSCSGAYIPARIALREKRERGSGTL